MPSRKMSKLKKENQATSVTAYLLAKYRVFYAPATVGLDGKIYRWDGENWLPEKKFKAMNPVPTVVHFMRSKSNPDKRNSFMQ
jgi:hypothetical protein